MSKLLCVYHADCADGFASAWAVHRRFGDEVEFVAAKYGDIPPYCESPRYGDPDGLNCQGLDGRDVLIVDFSYPRATLEAMAREARSVLVLDHHATAQEDLSEIPVCALDWDDWLRYGAYHSIGKLLDPIGMAKLKTTLERDHPKAGRLAAVFDMSRSGAGLTWDYLRPGEPRPRIIDLVEDRDLWRFTHDPATRQFHAAAASYGYEATAENFDRWDEWDRCSIAAINGGSLTLMAQAWWLTLTAQAWWSLLSQGAAILRAEARLVEGIVRGTHRTMRIAGHIVPVACCPGALASEVGNVLCKENHFGLNLADGKLESLGMSSPAFSATYYDSPKGRHFSLRSLPLGADVSKIAKHYGGGGHRNAAGFITSIGWEGE